MRALLTAFLIAVAGATGATAAPSSATLERAMDAYLGALTRHDVTHLPVAATASSTSER